AEDGIRDRNVTGVQTCALPISALDKKRTKRYRKTFGNFYGCCFSSKCLHGCEKNIVPTGKTSESMGVMVAFTSAVASDYWGINFRKKVTDRLLWKPK